MSITDIFSISFLCCLGISLLLIGLLSIYFNNKLMEQEHKISAMFGIVTTMADQIQFLRTNRNIIVDPAKCDLDVNNYMPFANTNLINVSDEENDEEEEDDEDEDDDASSTTSSSSSSSSSSEEDIDESKIKVINMSEDFDINQEIIEIIEIFDKEQNKVVEDKAQDKAQDNAQDKATTKFDFKEFKMDIDTESELDNKKMSLGKLRQIVSEKGLSTDASKLKKPELLKLLSIETV